MFILVHLNNNEIEVNANVFKLVSVLSGIIPISWTNILYLFKKNINEEVKLNNKNKEQK